MPTGLIHDERFLRHDTGPRHPERPDRLRAITAMLRATGLWDKLAHLPFHPASIVHVDWVHAEAYIERVRLMCERGEAWIDTPDSAICPESYEVALLAAGGVIAAVDAVMLGRCDNAFCAVRPPGHHAEHGRSMGFCLFNNVALAAERLLRDHKLERIAIVDFDVHHGNGTQHTFEERADVLFISIHEHPRYLYPGTGYEHERGRGPGEGFTLNVPLLPHGGDEEYRKAFEERILPALEAYRPQALLVSAGFDAAAADPLAHMEVSADGFEWMTRRLRETAQKHCAGRLISTLEGGYDLEALSEGVRRHIEVLME